MQKVPVTTKIKCIFVEQKPHFKTIFLLHYLILHNGTYMLKIK